MSRVTFLRSFRLVCQPCHISLAEDLLREEGYVFEAEPFSPFCRRLLHEPRPLGSSLAAFFGYIYIQDRSAMLPPLALAPGEGGAILDMCASPGGKSGFLAQLAGPDAFVLANEPNAGRLATLRANLRLMGLLNVGSCSYPGEKIPLSPDSWSRILLDPPCSGWGTLNKNPRAASMWSGAKVDRLVALQRALLRKAAELLRAGGLLLYSTCTTNFEENEAQTSFAEREIGLERVPLAPIPGFVYEERQGGQGCLLVEGETSKAQGFYLSLLRKPGSGTRCGPPERHDLNPPGHLVPPEALATPVCDPALLPAGKVGVFNRKARFLPAASACLPREFVWRGALLGAYSANGNFCADSRAKGILRLPGEGVAALVFDDAKPLREMLTGKYLHCGARGKEISLWWRGLPLGRAALKDGRVVAAFRQTG